MTIVLTQHQAADELFWRQASIAAQKWLLRPDNRASFFASLEAEGVGAEAGTMIQDAMVYAIWRF